MVQVIEESPLGINVELVPSGETGLIYNDEAGFVPDSTGEPVAIGDVVAAHVLKVRDDGRLDLSFRPAGGAKVRTADAASTLLGALFAARERGAAPASVPLGDVSSPASIKLSLGLSKASFKAARGVLLKAGVLDRTDSASWPTETRLASGATWPRSVPREPPNGTARPEDVQRCALVLSQLPTAAAEPVVGAAALLELLDVYGDVSSLRGLVADGRPTGRVQVLMESEEGASAAFADLSRYRVPPRIHRGTAAPPNPNPGIRAGLSTAQEDHGSDVGVLTSGNSRTCFVGNLPLDATSDELWDVFLDCGYISDVDVAIDGATGASRGFGRITFVDEDGVGKALLLRGTKLREHTLRVERAHEIAGEGDAADANEGYDERYADGTASSSDTGGGMGGIGGIDDLDEDAKGMLDAWLAAKRARNYDLSDALRVELESLGIEPEKLLPPPNQAATGSPRSGRHRPSGYQREEGDVTPIDAAFVEELLARRCEMRRVRDFDAADAIRGELGRMGVYVVDKELKWYAGMGNRAHPDTRRELDARARGGADGRSREEQLAATDGSSRLFLGNVPAEATEADVRGLLSVFGPVADVVLRTGGRDGHGFGHVQFVQPAGALVALKESDRGRTLSLLGAPLRVEPAAPPTRRRSQGPAGRSEGGGRFSTGRDVDDDYAYARPDDASTRLSGRRLDGAVRRGRDGGRGSGRGGGRGQRGAGRGGNPWLGRYK